MEHDKVTSENGRFLPLAELQRRLALTSDQWSPPAALDAFSFDAAKYLASLRSAQMNGMQPE